MHRAAATLAFLLVALAGCFGGGGSDGPGETSATPTPTPDEQAIRDFEDSSHPCVARADPGRQHAPDLEGRPWRFGQTWTYAFAAGPNATADVDSAEELELVYYALRDQGAHYMVGVADRGKAVEHALFSTNPLLGRIHRALYSPHEGGEHADMFHFPLCEGLEWTTLFYGETFTLRATAAAVEVPGIGLAPGWLITGSSAEGSTLRHTYSLDAGWFTELTLERPGGDGVAMRLRGLGEGYTGEAHFLRGQQDYVLDLSEPGLAANRTTIERLDGDEGPYDTLALDITLEAVGGTGHAQLELAAPDGTVVASLQVGDVAGEDRATLRTEVPYQAGNWTLTRLTVPPAVEGVAGLELAGELRIVSVYDRGGSL